MTQDDLSERFVYAQRHGAEGLHRFLEVVTEKRALKVRQLEDLAKIACRRSAEFNQPVYEQTWCEDARRRVREVDQRLAQFQENAMQALESYDDDNNNRF